MKNFRKSVLLFGLIVSSIFTNACFTLKTIEDPSTTSTTITITAPSKITTKETTIPTTTPPTSSTEKVIVTVPIETTTITETKASDTSIPSSGNTPSENNPTEATKTVETQKIDALPTVTPSTITPFSEAPITEVPTTEIPPTEPIVTEPPQAQLQLISVTSPIAAGSTATITVSGAPNTSYFITVHYKSGDSTAEGLGEKISDGNGSVSWSWMVGSRTTPGTWSATISGGGQSISVSFEVT